MTFGTVVSPACAGMIPGRYDGGDARTGEPRMRGDDPGRVL